MKDFFISYNKADRDWATWIAWVLEKAGFSVVIQAWDFRPGSNFVLEMQQALRTSQKTVMVLSEDYLKSSFTAPEWAAMFAEDPEARERKLTPVRVRECRPEGLLRALIYVDLVGLAQDDAEAALLGAFSERAKPSRAPLFPGGAVGAISPVSFPGPSTDNDRLTQALKAAQSDLSPRSGNAKVERLKLIQTLNGISPGQFNVLLFALNPPAGLVRPMPAPQAERSSDLLVWAEGPSGCGLESVEEVLEAVLDPLQAPRP